MSVEKSARNGGIARLFHGVTLPFLFLTTAYCRAKIYQMMFGHLATQRMLLRFFSVIIG